MTPRPTDSSDLSFLLLHLALNGIIRPREEPL
jgi:hypothetical protein